MPTSLGYFAVAITALGTAAGTGCASASFDLRATTPVAPTEPGHHAVAIVRIPAPWYAPRFAIARRFRAAVPDYEHVPGLVAKAFTIDEDRRFGGIYVWADRAAATTYYSASWRADIRERRGHDPDVVVFDAPFVVRGRAVLHGERIDARAQSYPATATLVVTSDDVTGPGDPGAARLAQRISELDGLVAGAVIVTAGKLGYIALWARRELAEAAVGRDATYFDAPVLLL